MAQVRAKRRKPKAKRGNYRLLVEEIIRRFARGTSMVSLGKWLRKQVRK
jgi:hypothetical protein